MPFIQMISFPSAHSLSPEQKGHLCDLEFGSWFLYSGAIHLVPLCSWPWGRKQRLDRVRLIPLTSRALGFIGTLLLMTASPKGE